MKETTPADNSSETVRLNDYSFFYGHAQVLQCVSLTIQPREVTALIGPSGCGKSTLIRSINRMNDLIDGAYHSGDIQVAGRSIYDPDLAVISLRKRVGMIFQKSNPFPKSVYENVAYPLRIAGVRDKPQIDEVVETTLRKAALWSEVKSRLNASAFSLSGGQMQRLCIARALVNDPEVLLMDEPCSALDPIATARIEELIEELKHEYTIVLVTHNLQQAARVSDRTAFLLRGELVEIGATQELFFDPQDRRTEDYVSGRFG